MNIKNELVILNIDHTLTMAYLHVTNVLIKCNDLDYSLYNQLRNEIKRELDRLKLKLIKDVELDA